MELWLDVAPVVHPLVLPSLHLKYLKTSKGVLLTLGSMLSQGFHIEHTLLQMTILKQKIFYQWYFLFLWC